MNKLFVAMMALAMLVGCTSEPSKPAEPEKPKAPDILTGRAAFQKMFIQARHWAIDSQPYRLESQPNSDSKGRDGKSAIWRASFASPGQMHATKPFIWSGTSSSDAPSRGVSPGTEDTYSPANNNTRVFDSAFLRVDSNEAFETAQKHGGDKVLEKNPDLPVIY